MVRHCHLLCLTSSCPCGALPDNLCVETPLMLEQLGHFWWEPSPCCADVFIMASVKSTTRHYVDFALCVLTSAAAAKQNSGIEDITHPGQAQRGVSLRQWLFSKKAKIKLQGHISSHHRHKITFRSFQNKSTQPLPKTIYKKTN